MDLRDLRSAAMRCCVRVTTEELLPIVRGTTKPSSALVPYACEAMAAPGWRLSPCRALCGCCPGAELDQAVELFCARLCWLAAPALCQQSPSLAHAPLFPEFSWSMAGLLEVALFLLWGHTDLPSCVWQAEAFVPSSGRGATIREHSAVF